MVSAAGFEPASACLRGRYNMPLYDALWCTWRVLNPQSVSYKETATCQLAATRTWCQRLNSNQLQQGYESCDYPLRLRWHNLVWRGRRDLNPQVRLWRPTVCQLAYARLSSLITSSYTSKRTIKNPALGRVRCIDKYTQTLNTRLPK